MGFNSGLKGLMRFLDHIQRRIQAAELLWTSNQLVAETYIWQHTHRTDIHANRWDSKPQSFLWGLGPLRTMTSSLMRFLDHTQRRIQAAELLWTSNQLVAETYIWQHTHRTHIHANRWDSKPQSQQPRSRRPIPYIAHWLRRQIAGLFYVWHKILSCL